MTNLLPCPFCGGEADYGYDLCIISCKACGASTDFHDTTDEAIAAWNCRIEPDGQLVGITLTNHEENES